MLSLIRRDGFKRASIFYKMLPAFCERTAIPLTNINSTFINKNIYKNRIGLPVVLKSQILMK